jgi:glycosyltransferase involved in cell wall biosynthesis
VVPSVWPEPFGLVGPEAAAYGVPAAAYAVGGIPDWLQDGVNGHLAPGNPPMAAGLADAIVNCLGDPAHYEQLRRGALAAAQTSDTVARHAAAVAEVLGAVARRPRLAESLAP